MNRKTKMENNHLGRRRLTQDELTQE
jgi:hypothetical protein